MSKNKFYFSHDGGARNDDKIIAVRMKLKAEGYAVYFMILEKLLESTNYMSVKDYNVLAFDFRVGADVVKSVIEDFGLFEFSECGKYFYSTKFNDRMKPLDKLREQRREAGRKSAEKRSKSQNSNESSTTVQRPLTEKPTKDKRREENIYNNTSNEDIIIISEIENFEKKQNEIDLNSDLENQKNKSSKKVAPKKVSFSKNDFKQSLLNHGANEQHIDDWFKVRVSKKATFTETALNAFVNECEKNQFSVADAVRVCAERSWQGFKYQWILNEQANGTNPTSPTASNGQKQPYFFDRERAMQALTSGNTGGFSKD